jgi:hypothetical protein
MPDSIGIPWRRHWPFCRDNARSTLKIPKYLKALADAGTVLYTVQPNEAEHNHMGF